MKVFAKFLAKSGRRVGVLNLQSWAAQFNVYQELNEGESSGMQCANREYIEEPIETLNVWNANNRNKRDIIECLDSYARKLDCLLLVLGPEFGRYSSDLMLSVDCVCVITDTNREHIISAYQAIKNCCVGNDDLQIGVFVVDAESQQRADAIYARLARTAEEHIGCKVRNFGCCLRDVSVVSSMIARQHLRTDSGCSIEQWIADLKVWLAGHKNNVSGMSDMNEIDDRDISGNKNEFFERKTSMRRYESNSEKYGDNGRRRNNCVNVSGDRIIKICEFAGEEKQFLALHIGKQILGANYKAVSSDLIDFLRNSGISCARFISKEDEKCCFVIVSDATSDKAIVDWVLNNYPHNQDEIVIVSSNQLGYIETCSWRKMFERIRIVSMLKGNLEGENVIILSC